MMSGMDGINEAGLGVSIHSLKTPELHQDTGAPDLLVPRDFSERPKNARSIGSMGRASVFDDGSALAGDSECGEGRHRRS